MKQGKRIWIVIKLFWIHQTNLVNETSELLDGGLVVRDDLVGRVPGPFGFPDFGLLKVEFLPKLKLHLAGIFLFERIQIEFDKNTLSALN